MIHVLATIRLVPGRRDEFLKEFREVVPLVRQEAGCLRYVPTVDVDSGLSLQKEVREDVVTVVEEWESLETLKAHLDAPHMHAYRARVKEMVQGATAEILEDA